MINGEIKTTPKQEPKTTPKQEIEAIPTQEIKTILEQDHRARWPLVLICTLFLTALLLPELYLRYKHAFFTPPPNPPNDVDMGGVGSRAPQEPNEEATPAPLSTNITFVDPGVTLFPCLDGTWSYQGIFDLTLRHDGNEVWATWSREGRNWSNAAGTLSDGEITLVFDGGKSFTGRFRVENGVLKIMWSNGTLWSKPMIC